MPMLAEGGLAYCIGITLLCLREFAAEPSGWTAMRNPPQMPHEIIIPQWKADASSGNHKHPLRAELRITAEGRNFIVDVEKNEDLFAPDYTETHYTKTGTAQTISLNKTDNCFYHGRVRAIRESSVVLSTCRGLRGLILISNNISYVLEPLPDSQEQHLIYRSEHLKVPHGSCGNEHLESKVTDWLAELTGRTETRHHRVKRDDQQSMKYVELLLVADYAECTEELWE